MLLTHCSYPGWSFCQVELLGQTMRSAQKTRGKLFYLFNFLFLKTWSWFFFHSLIFQQGCSSHSVAIQMWTSAGSCVHGMALCQHWSHSSRPSGILGHLHFLIKCGWIWPTGWEQLWEGVHIKHQPHQQLQKPSPLQPQLIFSLQNILTAPKKSILPMAFKSLPSPLHLLGWWLFSFFSSAPCRHRYLGKG